MQAIGFNEHYRLQTLVFEKIKTKTRRTERLSLLEGLTEDYFWFGIVDGKKQIQLYDSNPGPEIIMPRYNIGEVVAVRQCYRDIICQLPDRQKEYVIGYYSGSKAWTNKMFIRPDLMPRHIRITDVELQRLQSISDDDCLKEGILKKSGFPKKKSFPYYFAGGKHEWDNSFSTPRKAFAALIDRISGKGTWERNPWVFAYSFELID